MDQPLFRSGRVLMLSGLPFESHGAFPAQGGVSAAWVVEAVDVFEEGEFDLSAGLLVPSLYDFGLEGFEKALDGGIIMAIAFAAHPLPDSGCLHQ